MTNPSNIERIVMRRVHTVRVIRPLFSAGALAFFILAIALWGVGKEVWVARVFENAPSTLADASRFWLYAFEHTRLTVQALALLTLASLIYLARATASLIGSVLTPARA